MSQPTNDDKRLTILQHLEELRRRMTYSAIFVVVTTIVGFIIAPRLFEFLKRPAEGHQLIFIEVTEMLGIYFKVSLYAGLAMAMPFLMYQLFAFAAPGLTPRERRWFYVYIPWVVASFAAGAAFAYLVFLPRTIPFLLTFGNEIAQPQIRIGNYINMVVTLIFWMGVVFETPVVLYFLARLGVVNHRMLAKRQRWAVLGSFVLAGIITPTFDPINQIIVAVPLILLYEISIVLTWLARRGKKAAARQQASSSP